MKLEVFFDYICPYCYRGQDNLEAMLKNIPGWKSCGGPARPIPGLNQPGSTAM